jgi:NAD(P)H-hydrate repair Nnr-like enzyme with NAD(P)H-hydrate epimerase domain
MRMANKGAQGMTDLLTNAQMRAVEAAAIAQGRVNGRVLMERAGECVVAFIIITWPDLLNDVGRAVVLCGPGNNGGDGYAVARLLRDRYWQVFVHGFCGKPY